MLICKDEKSYRCSKIKSTVVLGSTVIRFSILEPISQNEVASLLEDNTFYFYDDVLQGRLPDTDNTKMVGLRIEYNADSTCNITIKFRKEGVANENQI